MHTAETTGNLSHFSLRARFWVRVPPSDAATVGAELAFLGAGRMVKHCTTAQTGVLDMMSRRIDFIRMPAAIGLDGVERKTKLCGDSLVPKAVNAQL